METIEETRRKQLLKLIQEKYKSQAGFIRATGINQGELSAILRGKKSFGEKKARKIERDAGLNYGWLDQDHSSANVVPVGTQQTVPLISWVQAGRWTGIGNIENLAEAEYYPCIASHGPNTYALRVNGKSMYDPAGKRSYDEGDIIFVDPDRAPENGNRVIARHNGNDEATFKQLVIEEKKQYLMALNPNWPEKFLSVTEEVEICGVVIGKWVPE